MKRILTTLSQKWPEYLLEMVVITAGIIGAFMLNQWKETNDDKEEAQLMLKQLRSNLVQDSVAIHESVQWMERYDSSVVDLQSFNGDIYHRVSMIPVINTTIHVSLNTAAFDLYTSSGKIELIPDSLSLRLQNHYLLYETWQADQDFFNETIEEGIRPLMTYHIITEETIQSAIAKKGNSMRQSDSQQYELFILDPQLHRYLMFQKIGGRVLGSHFRNGLKEIRNVIEQIDLVLN